MAAIADVDLLSNLHYNELTSKYISQFIIQT